MYGSRIVEAEPESPRGAQKCAHPLVNLHLEIFAGGIFTIDRENPSSAGLDTVCVDFEEVLLCEQIQTEGVPDNGQEKRTEK